MAESRKKLNEMEILLRGMAEMESRREMLEKSLADGEAGLAEMESRRGALERSRAATEAQLAEVAAGLELSSEDEARETLHRNRVDIQSAEALSNIVANRKAQSEGQFAVQNDRLRKSEEEVRGLVPRPGPGCLRCWTPWAWTWTGSTI